MFIGCFIMVNNVLISCEDSFILISIIIQILPND